MVFGLVMTMILLFYASWKFQIMINYENNTVQVPKEINHYSSDFVYKGSQDGWRIAFNLVGYDSSTDPDPLTEAYGTVFAAEYTWGEKDADGNIKPTGQKRLPLKKCSAEDINMDGSGDDEDFVFYQPDVSYKNDIVKFYPQLWCIDGDNRLMGDYNTAQGVILNLAFEVCDGKPICHPRAKIMNWLRRKFMVVLENTMNFDRENVKNNGIKRRSRLNWNVASP